MFYKFPKIHVPQDAYTLIKAMDRLIGQFPATPMCIEWVVFSKTIFFNLEGDESPPVLCTIPTKRERKAKKRKGKRRAKKRTRKIH
jgi:hypothetical protein